MGPGSSSLHIGENRTLQFAEKEHGAVPLLEGTASTSVRLSVSNMFGFWYELLVYWSITH